MTVLASDYQKFVFDNGLRLIVVPLEGLESATILIMVGAGSRYETVQINGVSHFLEHMFFKGSKKRPTAFDISVEIDSIGGQINAFTSKDHTGFYIKAASKHLPLAMDVLADMLLNPLLDPEEMQKEKGVILEELKMRNDTPVARITDRFEALLFGDHPLGWTIDGRAEVIRKLISKNLRSYLKNHYFSGNTVVAISGEVNTEQAKVLAQEKLISLAAKKAIRPKLFKEPQEKPALTFQQKETDQTHLIVGVRGYPYKHPNHFSAIVLTTILGRGMSSRLFTEVREKRGLVYYIRADMEEYLETGYIAAQTGVDTQKVEEAVKVILGEFAKLRTRKVGSQELAKAKEYLKGRLILSLEDSKAVAASYASRELLENRILTPADLIDRIAQVTPEEVQRVAKEIFVPEGLNLTLIGPKANKGRLTEILKAGLGR